MHFSLKNPRTIAIVFISVLTIVTCCMSLWGTFANVGIIPPYEQEVGWIGHIGYKIALYSTSVLLLFLIVMNVSFAVTWVRKTLAAQQWGTLLLVAICFILSLLIGLVVLLAQDSFSVTPTSLFFLFQELVEVGLLAGYLLTAAAKIREVLVTSQKHLLFLIFVSCLMIMVPTILHLYYFYIYTYGKIPSFRIYAVPLLWGDFLGAFWDTQAPFAALATLCLIAASSKVSRQLLRDAFLPTILITLTSVVFLIASLSWTLSAWLGGPLITERWRGPLGIVTVLLVLATGVLLTVVRQGFRVLTHSDGPVEEGVQPLPAQSQKQY